jgi:hypothetical protein
VTLPSKNENSPDGLATGNPQRVDLGAAEPARRIATREEMLAAAAEVFARTESGRHRTPAGCTRWRCAAGLTWRCAPALWACLHVAAVAAVLSAVTLLVGPVAAVAATAPVAISGVLLCSSAPAGHRR